MALKYTTLPEAAREASKNLCAFLLMRVQKKGPSMIVTLKKKKNTPVSRGGARAPPPPPHSSAGRGPPLAPENFYASSPASLSLRVRRAATRNAQSAFRPAPSISKGTDSHNQRVQPKPAATTSPPPLTKKACYSKGKRPFADVAGTGRAPPPLSSSRRPPGALASPSSCRTSTSSPRWAPSSTTSSCTRTSGRER